MPAPIADPHLARLAAEVAAVSADSRRLCSPLDEGQLLWSPAPHRWSIAHCFAHLNTTADLYYGRVGHAIERTRAAGAYRRRPWRPSLLGRAFLWLSAGGVRIPVPAPPRLRPSNGAVTAAAPGAFLDRQSELSELLHSADGLDLSRETIGSPATRHLRLDLGEVLAMLVGHTRRHLEQARRVAAATGFPRS